MGLDIVEYVMALEDAFGIDIPDAEAAELRTVGQTIDYLCSRLPMAANAAETGATPLEQLAFHRLRAAIQARTGVPKRHLRPRTPAREAVTDPEWRPLWQDLAPGIYVPSRAGTLGDAARQFGIARAGALKADGARWTRAEIEEVVWSMCERELGIERAKFTLASSYVDDMRID